MSLNFTRTYKKIDIHCHTTKRKLGHTVSSDATLAFIASQMFKYQIEKTLLLATYFPQKGTGVSNFRMRYWMDEIPRTAFEFIMFGSLDFEHYFLQGMSELEEMADKKLIRGVKVYSGYQNIPPTKLLDVVNNICKPYNLPIMFHTGDCTGTGVFADIPFYYDTLIEGAPEVSFMFSHMANPMIDKVIDRVKRYKNVYTDMSGLLHSGKEDHELPHHIASVRRFYDECGIEQFMWGTDFPVTTHEHAVFIAENALHGFATPDELEKFYYLNAKKVLNLND